MNETKGGKILSKSIEKMKSETDEFPWYWLSYGEKCYAFATVAAVPVDDGATIPTPGTELLPHPEEEQVWIGENGTAMIVESNIANIERQNGDTICEFIAIAHSELMSKSDS